MNDATPPHLAHEVRCGEVTASVWPNRFGRGNGTHYVHFTTRGGIDFEPGDLVPLLFCIRGAHDWLQENGDGTEPRERSRKRSLFDIDLRDCEDGFGEALDEVERMAAAGMELPSAEQLAQRFGIKLSTAECALEHFASRQLVTHQHHAHELELTR